MRTLLFSLTLILLVSCKAQQASIAHVEWKLIKMGDTDLSVLDQPVTLTLDETNNKVSGHAGCNRFFGAYQSENATITFSGLGSTKMFCQDKMVLRTRTLKHSVPYSHTEPRETNFTC